MQEVGEADGEQSEQGKDRDDEDMAGDEMERVGGEEVCGILSIIMMDDSAEDRFNAEAFLCASTGVGDGSAVAGWSGSSEPAADIRKSRLLKRPDRFAQGTTTSAALGLLLPLQMQLRC